MFYFVSNTLVRTRDVSLSVVHNAEIAACAAINFLESCASRRKSEFFGTERIHFLESIRWILSRKLNRVQAPWVSKLTEPHELMCKENRRSIDSIFSESTK